MAELELRSLVKTYPGGRRVVDDLSLSVPDGSFAVLVGPSGCGKSTTLRMIAGLEKMDGGDVLIGGERVNGVSPQRRDIAFVFQNFALYPHMTVADNMGFGLRMRKVRSREIEQRVGETAAMLGLELLLRRYPMQLSGGERQRVALGRAIVRDPSVFLLDEPLSNLDAQLRGEMRLGLARIQRRLQATFVFVTHDQVEAMTLADVLAVMRAGVLQQVAPPDEIYAAPANTFVAGFIGSPKMNLLEGTADGAVLRVGTVELALGATAPRAAGPLTVGVRPEHARLDPDGPLELRVEVVESLGSQKFVYGTLGPDVALTIGVDPRMHPREGDSLRLSLPAESLHFFDSESGQRL
jgi:sn-glycerol 3-phosphate transport system ATP-binding protein